MSYVDGFIVSVPKINKLKYLEHAKSAALALKENGALSVVETWEDEVPNGEVTSFPMAVQKKPDEAVVFSWIVWPSKDVRNKGWQAVMEDPRMHPDENPMPYDGKRLIYGGFKTLLTL